MKTASLRSGIFGAKKGQSILEIVIYMVILGVIALAGSIGYSVYLTDANGSACNTQLNQLDVADKSFCATYNVTAASGLPTYTDSRLLAFIGGRPINTGTNAVSCPGAGTYSAPTAFNTGTTDPLYPTCSLGTSAFSGTRFHSITIIP